MYDYFTTNLKIEDEFIDIKEYKFIRQLIAQQENLNIEFDMMDTDKNLARKNINMEKSLRPKTSSYLVTAHLCCYIESYRTRFIKERYMFNIIDNSQCLIRAIM